MRMCVASKDKTRACDLLELELYLVISLCMDAGNATPGPLQD